MSNNDSSLAVAPQFLALTSSNNAAALLEANLGGASLRASDLTWVKIPTGGATRWSWQAKSGEEGSEKTIAGLLVVCGRTEQTLWPHADATPGSQPLLVSTDARSAFKVGSDYGDLDANVIEAAKRPDGSYDVSKIPYFHWTGRGPGSIPPRAKSSRVVGILRESETAPLFIRVSQTSLRAVDDLLRGITSEGLFHYRAVVELSLEKKKGTRADYAVLVARKVGSVSEEFGMAAKSRFTDSMTDIVCPPAESRGSWSPAAAATCADTATVPF